jgi:hypothetical protein
LSFLLPSDTHQLSEKSSYKESRYVNTDVDTTHGCTGKKRNNTQLSNFENGVLGELFFIDYNGISGSPLRDTPLLELVPTPPPDVSEMDIVLNLRA